MVRIDKCSFSVQVPFLLNSSLLRPLKYLMLFAKSLGCSRLLEGKEFLCSINKLFSKEKL